MTCTSYKYLDFILDYTLTNRGSVCVIMPGKILPQEFVDIFSIGGIWTRIQHRTATIAQVVPHDQGNLP